LIFLVSFLLNILRHGGCHWLSLVFWKYTVSTRPADKHTPICLRMCRIKKIYAYLHTQKNLCVSAHTKHTKRLHAGECLLFAGVVWFGLKKSIPTLNQCIPRSKSTLNAFRLTDTMHQDVIYQNLKKRCPFLGNVHAVAFRQKASSKMIALSSLFWAFSQT